jgi:hypothetical protein
VLEPRLKSVAVSEQDLASLREDVAFRKIVE